MSWHGWNWEIGDKCIQGMGHSVPSGPLLLGGPSDHTKCFISPPPPPAVYSWALRLQISVAWPACRYGLLSQLLYLFVVCCRLWRALSVLRVNAARLDAHGEAWSWFCTEWRVFGLAVAGTKLGSGSANICLAASFGMYCLCVSSFLEENLFNKYSKYWSIFKIFACTH